MTLITCRHHFIALTREERNDWVEVINVASNIYKTAACKVSGQLTVEGITNVVIMGINNRLIFIAVVEGKNLAPKDFHLISGNCKLKIKMVNVLTITLINEANTSDPYAVLRINSQQNKTKTIYKNLNPVWKEEFSLYVQERKEKKRSETKRNKKKINKNERQIEEKNRRVLMICKVTYQGMRPCYS